ncbi:MAG: hypothetical protein GXO77_13915, partial [Calditrichaeota bacterium]|nr:hypothetical protein [Calditrichota bacterium]
WFGTHDGLNRYDGYEFKIFRHNAEDSLSISHNSITTIYEDSPATLWIGTIKGLNKFDVKSETFKQYDFIDVGKIEALPERFFPQIHDRYLLLGTGTGLFLFDKISGNSKKLDRPILDSWQIKGIQVFCYVWQPGPAPVLWIGTNGYGIWRLEFKGLQITKSDYFPLKYRQKIKFDSITIRDLLINQDTLWVSCGIGLFYLPLKIDPLKLRSWSPCCNKNFLSGASIRSFLIDKNGDFWIGTMRRGLFYYKRKAKKKRLELLNDNAVFSIFQDSFNTIWVGTSGAGIFKYDMDKVVFKTYKPFPKEQINSQFNQVWSVYQDERDLVWVGTNHGIKFFVPGSKLNSAELVKKRALAVVKKIGNVQVRDIVSDKRGNIWIATLEKGLFQVKENGDILNFREQRDRKTELPSNIIYTLFVDSQQNLWIGMNDGGLSKALRRNNRVYGFKNYYNLTNKNPQLGLWVMDIVETKDDTADYLWLATWEKGLIRFNKRTEKIKSFISRHESGLNSDYILTLHYSASFNKPTLWLGTYGGGLTKLDLTDYTFSSFTEKDGLCNNMVYAILEDNNHNLWVSTNKGISMFNPRTEQFINYTEKDGLQSAEFNLNAAYKNRAGELFFGGINGLNYFTPKNTINQIPPIIEISKITIYGKNKKTVLKAPFEQTIDLDYTQNILQIDFIGLHSKDPEKHQYAYQMTGWGDNWIYTGSQRKATFMNLEPGEYTFRVKGCNGDGIWNESGQNVKIVIHPPFWKTNWAMAFYLLFIGGLFYTYHRRKVLQAVKIARIKEQERIQTKKEIDFDLHDELGVHITNIIQFCNKLLHKKNMVDKEVGELINKIHDHAYDLESEVGELVWEVKNTKCTLEDLIAQLKSCAESVFNENVTNFQIHNRIMRAHEIDIPIKWRRNIIKIFKEGIHNILRHAKNYKNIDLIFELKDKQLHIILIDDGDGFDVHKDYLGKGLKSMRHRAELIGSKIEIYSKKGQGTSVHFSGKLP